MIKRNYNVFPVISLISLFLVSCNAIYKPSDLNTIQPFLKWRMHRQSIDVLNRYQIRGALLYLSNQKKIYIRFNWQQMNQNHYRIIFTNLIGNTEMDIHVQLGIAKLVDSKGTCYISKDLETAFQRMTGIYIPINNLRQWILGLPGTATNFTINSNGYLYTINYSYNRKYWRVIYKEYNEHAVPVMPSNIELYQGDNYIKLKIYNLSLL